MGIVGTKKARSFVGLATLIGLIIAPAVSAEIVRLNTGNGVVADGALSLQSVERAIVAPKVTLRDDHEAVIFQIEPVNLIELVAGLETVQIKDFTYPIKRGPIGSKDLLEDNSTETPFDFLP